MTVGIGGEQWRRAIGDAASALHPVSVAVGQAAIAAAATGNGLPRNYRQDEASQAEVTTAPARRSRHARLRARSR